MKKLNFLFLFISISLTAQTVYKIPTDAKRILFLGNSITYQGDYISYLETILTLENPSIKREYINVGLPSETVSGLSEPDHAKGKFPRPDLRERLKRILDKTQPDFIFASYGINDGIYMPFDEKRFKKYKKGMMWLNHQITKRNIPVIYLTPIPYDKITNAAYSNVMDIYANWLMSLKYTNHWKVIDVHQGMKNQLLNERKTNPDFMFTRDGIHPKPQGHWIMTQQILSGLGIHTFTNFTTFNKALLKYNNGNSIFKLVDERQILMKDAWLTYTGHKRPNMNVGIPINEAQENYLKTEHKIKFLLNQ
ncbi:lysophospholipase L1-like esterase [Wenyingzhuangia heitensis]|uniref:Lysophospholipase L1-like esterase n=1 Tax=Wenyingzhuangia heitensis TaxID=1487859 RepID=A0ABX0U7Q1_9FLAO|nr:SGNH/GDSL hydrolase family protein [Wenyingzhuangia heitensis]NIJ44783.1 lysophospholipase L1-like esterase [Wenyingzhuangia heitensis]